MIWRRASAKREERGSASVGGAERERGMAAGAHWIPDETMKLSVRVSFRFIGLGSRARAVSW